MSRELRILHIASWYPSRVSSQNGNFIKRHVEAIASRSRSYLLHVVSDTSITESEVVESGQNGFHAVTVIYPKASLLHKLSGNRKANELGFQKLESLAGGFDMIHVHVMNSGIYFGQHIAQRLNLPLVVTEHATAYHQHHPETYSFFQTIFLRWYGRRVNRYFPVSDDLKQAMEQKGIKGKYQVIPNVVDTGLFSHQPRSSEGDALRFLHISSLKNAHKNVTGLLSAFATLLDTYPKTKLTIIGNEHHDQLERYIRKLRLINEVSLLKEVPLKSIAQQMRDHHALVLFSNYENAPCVISEALCTGMPVIATQVGGIPEMIDESNGLLVNKGDMLGLYSAMETMIQQYADYDSVHISQTAQAKYQYDHVSQLYHEAYQDVRASL